MCRSWLVWTTRTNNLIFHTEKIRLHNLLSRSSTQTERICSTEQAGSGMDMSATNRHAPGYILRMHALTKWAIVYEYDEVANVWILTAFFVRWILGVSPTRLWMKSNACYLWVTPARDEPVTTQTRQPFDNTYMNNNCLKGDLPWNINQKLLHAQKRAIMEYYDALQLKSIGIMV